MRETKNAVSMSYYGYKSNSSPLQQIASIEHLTNSEAYVLII